MRGNAAAAAEINDSGVPVFYHISKVAWFFLEPSNLFPAVAAGGIVLLMMGFVRLGRQLAGVGVALVFIFGLTPAPNWLILPLEMRFPPPRLEGRRIDGVIVLGGALLERQTLAHGPAALNDAGERLVAMADLARRFPQARIVFTGGAGVYSGAPLPEGEVLRRKLGEFGLAPDRVVIESRSVNTHENVVLTKAIADPKPGETWLLVTSSWHMPRSVGIFRRQGWEVVAYPVDHRTAGWGEEWRWFRAASDRRRRTDVAMREYVGLVVYRLTGRTDALFPAP
jgi:uncharacterized SAM-binding protein YcdF (DUF218 family)